MQSKLLQQLQQYYRCHQNRKNQLTHYIGIPAIIISVLMFFNWFSLAYAHMHFISFSYVILLTTLSYYYTLDRKSALYCGVWLIPLTVIITLSTGYHPNPWLWSLCGILFIGGWITQFIGHYFEHKKPSITENITHIFSAPLFITYELIWYCGFEKELQEKIRHFKYIKPHTGKTYTHDSA